MSRAVHYHAAGGGGLSFNCYATEMDAWLRTVRETKEQGVDALGHTFVRQIANPLDGTIPKPRCHTDLRNVTCPNCCRAIAKMMREKFLPAPQASGSEVVP